MSTNQSKKCSKCAETKPLTEYHKSTRDGYRSICKLCRKLEAKENWVNNKDYFNTYVDKNTSTIKEYRQEYYRINSEHIKEKSRLYRKGNIDECREKDKRYQQANRERINSNIREKIKTDSNFRITRNLRTRFHSILRGKIKAGHSIDILGCSITDFKLYIESKFKHGMLWGNYGRGGWELDHIRPCSSFNLEYIEQQKQCFHYSNMQPLWLKENRSKGSKW
jgi:hypothetical protein